MNNYSQYNQNQFPTQFPASGYSSYSIPQNNGNFYNYGVQQSTYNAPQGGASNSIAAYQALFSDYTVQQSTYGAPQGGASYSAEPYQALFNDYTVQQQQQANTSMQSSEFPVQPVQAMGISEFPNAYFNPNPNQPADAFNALIQNPLAASSAPMMDDNIARCQIPSYPSLQMPSSDPARDVTMGEEAVESSPFTVAAASYTDYTGRVIKEGNSQVNFR